MCKLHIMLELLDRLLDPLARLLIARGVLFPAFADRMKRNYLAAAERIVALEGQKVTDSRLSVMTGLQRRDIARLKALDPAPAPPTHLARLVALWQTDPAYSTGGQALTLARSGAEPSFETLARSVRRDIHPRTMLDALEVAGTLSVEDDRVTLLETSYQPLAGSEDQIAYLAANTGDHLAAATENVTGAGDPHFERAAHYGGLTPEQIAELKADYHAAQMDILRSLSQKAARMKRDRTGTARFRAGGYFYRTDGDQP